MSLCMHCFHELKEDATICPQCHQSTQYDVPSHHLQFGTRLHERYLIGHALGEGGFGITYIGWDELLQMRVAIKEYYPNGFSNRNHQISDHVVLTRKGSELDLEAEMQRFLHEAQRLAKFSSESGIVSVRDYFRANGTAYIVMEYLDGITLMELLNKEGKIPANQLFSMLDPVLHALELVHKEGLIHRDISPDNIMVPHNRQPKLLDFGAAREVSGNHSLSVVLKPGYAPAEQYRTKGQQGPWTDIYALCATMYKCLTGITPDASLDRIYEDSLLKPSELGIDITPQQEAAILKGLSVKEGARFQSISQLRTALGLASEEAPIHTIHIQSFPQTDDMPLTVAENSVPIKPVSPSAESDVLQTVYGEASNDVSPADKVPMSEKNTPEPEATPKPDSTPSPEPVPKTKDGKVICPYCGAKHVAGTAKCKYCGTAITGAGNSKVDPVVAEGPVPAPVYKGKPGKKAVCPYCGARQNEDAVNCKYCGTAMK